MRKEYDFSKAKKNPYAVVLKNKLQSGLMRKQSSILKSFQKKQKYPIKP